MSKFHATPKPANRRAFRPVVTVRQVTAKVGAITYSGYVDSGEFSYVTKGGVQKTARKFTLI